MSRRSRLREGVRFEETVELDLTYTLADGDDPQLRVRPSVVVFPAWGFGTTSEVTVTVPGGFEVRVDGDPMTEADGSLVSGEIADPSQWLALVTAIRPAEYTTFDATVPLAGGTADLQVRAFADDEAWGQRTLDLVERALPLLETEIGLPYPQVGALVVTESVATDASGFGESPSAGNEILIAFDQPEFTALHQVAHIWLSADLIESRWIREGMASDVAARVAAALDVPPAFDPVAQATALQAAAFPLDTWADSADPDGGVLRARRLVGVRRRAARRRRRRGPALGPRSRGRLDRPVRRRRHRAAAHRRRSPAADAAHEPRVPRSPRGGHRGRSRRPLPRADPVPGGRRAARGRAPRHEPPSPSWWPRPTDGTHQTRFERR